MVAEMEALYELPTGHGLGLTAPPADFSPPGGAFVVVYEDGKPIAGGGVKRDEDGVAEIKRMYVAPKARGRGLGRQLLEALEDTARSLGYARIRLDTGARQPRLGPCTSGRATTRSRTTTATRRRRSGARRSCGDRLRPDPLRRRARRGA